MGYAVRTSDHRFLGPLRILPHRHRRRRRCRRRD